MRKFLRDNSLSLAFFGLFAICLVGQVLSGYALQFEDPAEQAKPGSLIAYLADPTFLKGVFGNWQAALLQLLVLVVMSIFLRQRGASHSRKPEGGQDARRSNLRWFGRSRSWAYANSLSLALLGLFVVTFAAFFFANTALNDGHRARHGEAALGLSGSLVSADFWFQTFQTWQAEFFAMGAFLILSVYLRQEDSPESKAVDATDEETGETNE